MAPTSVRGRRSRRPSSGRPIACSAAITDALADTSRGRRPRLVVGLVFAVLLIGFAVGIWGTVVRPAAYEVRGTLMARPAANLLLVRHEAITGLGMNAMELMAVFADPAVVDRAGVAPGQRVRMAVRAQGDELRLLWIEKND